MGSADSRLSVKSGIFMAAGLSAFIIYLYLFVGFDEILKVLQKVDPLQYFLYYSLTIAAIVSSILFYSLVWRELLRALSIEITVMKSFLYCWIANFVDLVVPLETVSGEITRAYLLHNDLKGDFGKTAATLVCHRIISIFTTLSMLTASSLYLILRYSVEPNALYLLTVVTVGTAATIIILFYLSLREEAAGRLVRLLIRLAGTVIKDPARLADLEAGAERALSAFHQGVKTFGRNPKYLVKPVVYSYISWFCHLAIYFLVFYALGFPMVMGYAFQMIVVFSITLAVQTFPVGLPVGLVEAVMTFLYSLLLGVDPAVGGLATLLIRVVTFWFQILVGYAIAQWMGIKRTLGEKPHEEENLRK